MSASQTGLTFDVTGFKETYARLREIALAPAQRTEIRAGVQRGGEVIAELARRSVRRRSGNLQDSIETEKPIVTHNKVAIRIIAARPKGSHGALVEYGHMARGGKRRVRAYPFLGPALEEGQRAALREIALGVEKAMKRSVR